MQGVVPAQVWEHSHPGFILGPSLISQATSGHCLKALFFPVLWHVEVAQPEEGEDPDFI